jgi:glycogen debranching enzyme
MIDIKKKAYKKAKEVLNKCVNRYGFRAAYPGYPGVWARDSMITSLGTSLVSDNGFKEAFRRSLDTLAKYQSELGQIPNAVGRFKKNKLQVDYASIDSSLWFIIGEFVYKKRYKDNSVFNRHKKNIERALLWVKYQDTGEDIMPEQQPTSDWQDAFPHRYGHTINTQALYYGILKLLGKTEKASKLKRKVNDIKGGLWNGRFYLSYRWKDHGKYHEKGEWFDSLGNLLSILFELADRKKANIILSHIKKEKIDKPYPIKNIYPPIKKGSRDWYDYFTDCEADIQYHYANGAIWPYIGGFYVLALVKLKKFDEAERQLEKLAKANLQKDFWEWLDGRTGKPGMSGKGKLKFDNSNQAWNAGMYIAAYESLKQKKISI